MRLGVQGTFDNFNLFVAGVKGELETGLALIYDTLMDNGAGRGRRPSTASSPRRCAIRRTIPSVTYRLRQEARWHDGKPVTPADVIFSFETLKANSPQYAFYYKNVAKAEETGEREVTFTFSETGNRELPQIVGQLPVLPKHWWEGTGAGRAPPQPDRDHARAAARLRPLPPQELRRRPLRRLRARARLLGPRSAGEPRPAQFRRGPLRVLPRLDRPARGLQGRPLRLPGREQRPQLGDGLRLPGRAGGARRPGRIPGARDRAHAGLRVQPAPARKFQDARVRRAFNLAFDFEDINRTIFYGLYQRIDSFFAGTELASSGLPQGKELAILEGCATRCRRRSSPTPYRNPVNGSPEEVRGEPARGPAAAERGGLRAARTGSSSTSRPASPSRSSSSATTRPSSASSCPTSQALARIGIAMSIAHRRRGAVPEPAAQLRLRHDHRSLGRSRCRPATSSASSGARRPPTGRARATPPASRTRASTR